MREGKTRKMMVSGGGRFLTGPRAWSHLPAERKLNHWMAYLLMGGIAVMVGLLMADNLKIGMGFAGGVIGTAVVVACMVDTAAGLFINVVYSFVAFYLSRLLFRDEFPVGTASDILIFSTLLGLILRKVTLKETWNSFASSAAVICFLVYLGFGILQLFNPNSHSFTAWYISIRKLTGTYVILFVAYEVFKDPTAIRRYLALIFWCCLGLGLYGCIQQWHGLFNFEIEWVMSDDLRYGLMYIGGEFRKFSLLSDPMAFGLLMAACGLFFFILSMALTGRKRWIMRLGTIPMFLGMAYSGTRTANIMVVAGAAFFILLTLERKGTRVFAGAAAAVLLLLLYLPFYSNNTLNRFRSSFQGSQDESYKVREMNRHYIQPYIWTHPIGGGLCTTGSHGMELNPGHYLAGFPCDNGYLEKVLETGWIGLGLLCVLYFLILRTGIQAYFKGRTPYEKILAAACTCGIFSFYVATYSQTALGQISDIVIYYPFIAILLRLNEPGGAKAGSAEQKAGSAGLPEGPSLAISGRAANLSLSGPAGNKNLQQ